MERKTTPVSRTRSSVERRASACPGATVRATSSVSLPPGDMTTNASPLVPVPGGVTSKACSPCSRAMRLPIAGTS